MEEQSQSAHSSEIFDSFRAATGIAVRTGIAGRSCTTMAVGGELSALVEPDTIDQLAASIKFFSENSLRYRILGAGSNLLIADRGTAAWVVRLGKGFRSMSAASPGEFRIGGAASLMAISRELSGQGWSGLEFAGGIPASIGGAARMNAGAHGGEFSQILRSLECVDARGEIFSVAASELEFRYRHCSLPDGVIVAGVTIALSAADKARCAESRAKFLADRKRTQPLSLPSCGSVFKNPEPQRSAGSLIEQCGLKGRVHGGAQISELHANWIVNGARTASAADVLALIELCRDAVKARFALTLEPEVRIWSE